MYDAFKTNLESTVKESLTPDQFVSLLVANEWDDRKNRAVERANLTKAELADFASGVARIVE